MRRRNLALVCAAVAVLLLAVWQGAYHGVDPRLILWPPPQEIPPPAALDELTDLDVTEMPLADVLVVLSLKHHVTFDVDTTALANVGVSTSTPITRRISGVPLRSVLRLIMKDLDLVCGPRDGKLIVTTPEEWDGNLTYYMAKVYTLEKLLASPYEVDERQVAAVIADVIAPTTWADAGGAGQIRAIPGAIIVAQQPDIQEQVGLLLDHLAEVAANPDDYAPRDLVEPRNPREKRIEAALSETTSLDVVERLLKDVIDELADKHQIQIQIDTKALDGVGVSSDTPITRQVADISLRSALRLILRELDLTYLVRDDVLQITTPEIADNSLMIRVYPVGDLLDRRKGIDADALIDGIISVIHPTTWDDAGGAGAIVYCAGCLVISQTSNVHELAELFLEHTRRALRPLSIAATKDAGGAPYGTPQQYAVGGGMLGPSPRHDLRSAQDPATAQRFEAALAEPMTLDFNEAPLKKCIAEIRRRLDVEVQFDIKALDGVGVSSDTPITLHVIEIPLASALNQMLRNLDLTWIVREDVLEITTPEFAENTLSLRWHRLQGLLDGPWPGGRRLRASDLERIITATIAPTTWDDAGGAGQLIVLGNVLVVDQTDDVQRRVTDLLTALGAFQFSPPQQTPRRVDPPLLPERVAMLEAALKKAADVDFSGVTLQAAVDDLSQRFGVPIKLDLKALDGIGLARTDRVNLWAEGVPLCLVMEFLSSREHLAWNIRDHVLWITSPEIADPLDMRLYDVRDLTAIRPETDLVDLAIGVVAPTTWDDNGGAGSIEHVPGALVITQTGSVHRELETALDLLRKASVKHDLPPRERPSILGPDELRLTAALAARVSLDVENRPLDEALRTLLAGKGIGLILDRSALAGESPRVTYQAENQTLAEALDGLLEQACLTYCVREGTIVATSPEVATSGSTLRLYRVDDLPALTAQRFAPRQAAELQLERWAAGVAFPHQPSRPRPLLVAAAVIGADSDLASAWIWEQWLAVTTDSAAHRDIEALLAKVREIAQNRSPPRRPAQQPYSPLGAYDLRLVLAAYPELDERQLAEWIAAQTDHEVWSPRADIPLDFPAAVARVSQVVALPGMLVLRQTPAEQRQMVRSLEFLLDGAGGLPRPYELARDDCRAAVSRLARSIRQETDDLRLGYALWLATLVEHPTPDLAAALIERLAATDPETHAQRDAQLCRGIAHCGPLASAAVPILNAWLGETTDANLKRQWLIALASVGQDGRWAALRESARSPPAAIVRQVIEQIPAEEALPMLLNCLDDPAYSANSVVPLIRIFDPGGRGTKRILAEWDADDNADVRERAKRVRDSLNPPPIPSGMFGIGT